MRRTELSMPSFATLCLAAIVAVSSTDSLIPTVPTSQGQARPDLSGTWTPERGADAPPPPPPAPPAAPGVPAPPPPPTLVSLTIRQSASELRVERTMQLGGERAVYAFTYNLDGTETTNQMGPIVSKGTAAWNGERLTISSTYYHDGKQIGRGTETYAFEHGKLIVEGERVMPGGRFPSREIYSKGS
jgi:hypothetical protein